MSIEKPIITAVPAKVPAILIFEKKGTFKTGDKFEVSARAGLLFKAKRFRSIYNEDSFELHQATVNGKNQLPNSVLMFALTSQNVELRWPTCMTPETIVLSVEATSDVDDFACVLEGVTVRSKGDAQAHDYDREPLDVTVTA